MFFRRNQSAAVDRAAVTPIATPSDVVIPSEAARPASVLRVVETDDRLGGVDAATFISTAVVPFWRSPTSLRTSISPGSPVVSARWRGRRA